MSAGIQPNTAVKGESLAQPLLDIIVKHDTRHWKYFINDPLFKSITDEAKKQLQEAHENDIRSIFLSDALNLLHYQYSQQEIIELTAQEYQSELSLRFDEIFDRLMYDSIDENFIYTDASTFRSNLCEKLNFPVDEVDSWRDNLTAKTAKNIETLFRCHKIFMFHTPNDDQISPVFCALLAKNFTEKEIQELIEMRLGSLGISRRLEYRKIIYLRVKRFTDAILPLHQKLAACFFRLYPPGTKPPRENIPSICEYLKKMIENQEELPEVTQEEIKAFGLDSKSILQSLYKN